ncbi:hypothetical protein DC090_02755 [Trueperella pyogenes]|nr:hypothetical protein DC090_02755 [Trueperella pyogenes]AWG16174.1 hypothetical protein DDE06_04680 [Trueperella pyogenes]AZR05057.1 hypothetical protein EBQ11_07285 [Trueperella pyogenes]
MQKRLRELNLEVSRASPHHAHHRSSSLLTAFVVILARARKFFTSCRLTSNSSAICLGVPPCSLIRVATCF